MREKIKELKDEKKKVIVIHSDKGEASEYIDELVEMNISENTIYVSSDYIFPDDEQFCDPWQKRFRAIDEKIFNVSELRDALQNETKAAIILNLTASANCYAKESFLVALAGICPLIDAENRLVLVIRSEDIDFLNNASPYIKFLEIKKSSASDISDFIKSKISSAFSEDKLRRLGKLLEGKYYTDIMEMKTDLLKASASEDAFKELEYTISPSVKERDALTFSDILGNDKAKEMIQDFLYVSINRDELEKHEKNPDTGKGLLIYGPPGTAKTQLVKAASGEIGAPIYEFKPELSYSEYHGVSGRNIADFFDEVINKDEMSIIFIDEVDSVFRRRSSRNSEENASIINIFLKKVSEAASKPHILIIIASNRPYDIDPAFLRNQRIGDCVYVGLPDEKTREDLIRYKLRGEYEIDMERLVALTEGFSGADIFKLYSKANLIRSKVKCNRMETSHFLEALKTVNSTVSKEEVELVKNWKLVP